MVNESGRMMTEDAPPGPPGPARAGWPVAALATLHCLTGCAIGEVLGMVIGTAAGLHNTQTVILSIALAFGSGYVLTMRGVLRAGVGPRAAFRAALAAGTASIAAMELLDNAVILAVPGAMDAGPGTALFWASLAFSLAAAFALTVALNRWLIGRGKGHAVRTPVTGQPRPRPFPVTRVAGHAARGRAWQAGTGEGWRC